MSCFPSFPVTHTKIAFDPILQMKKQDETGELLVNGRGSSQASSLGLSVLKTCENIP